MPQSAEPQSLRELPEIRALRPWYHDFSRLGVRTQFAEPGPAWLRPAVRLGRAAAARFGFGGPEKGARILSRQHFSSAPSSHLVNQPVKEANLLPLIATALAGWDEPSCLDLFCADGYYSLTIARLAPGSTVVGVDLDAREIERAETMARALGADRARFVNDDVERFLARSAHRRFDLVLCAGGLYHLREPRELLERLRPLVGGHLVVQSVVSLANQSPDYFEHPAPGWRHGCRFSHQRLRGWLEKTGFEIAAERQSELPGNRRPSDRGSSYLLCRPV